MSASWRRRNHEKGSIEVTPVPVVAIVHLNKLSGGIDRMVANLLSAWKPGELDLMVFSREAKLAHNTTHLRQKWPFFVVQSPLRGLSLRSELALIRALRQCIRSHRRVILNPHDRIALAYCAFLRLIFPRRCRLAPTVHQLSSGLPTTPARRFVFRAIEHFGFRVSDCIITVCEARKREVQNLGIAREKVVVIYNGPNLADFGPPVPRDEARARLGLPQSSFIVAFVGRLSAEKGIGDLVSELQKREGALGEMILAVAGAGQLEDELNAFIAKNNLSTRVRLLGQIDNIALVYQAADVLVSPSRDEGLSMTILEAMSFGLPIVATAVGGTPELVDDSVGYILQPGDMPAVADALGALAANRAALEQKGASARGRVRSRFSLENMAEETRRRLLALRDEQDPSERAIA